MYIYAGDRFGGGAGAQLWFLGAHQKIFSKVISSVILNDNNVNRRVDL